MNHTTAVGENIAPIKFDSPLPWFLKSAWHLFGIFFLVLGLLAGTLAVLVSTHLRRSLEAEAVDQVALAAHLVTVTVEEHFDSLTNYVESFARRPLLLNAVSQKNAQRARAHLKDLVSTNQHFDRAFITDPGGGLWSDYPPSPEVIGKNFSWRDWFHGVSEKQGTYVSKVYRRSAPPRPYLVAIAVPIRNHDQEIVGYLVGQHTIRSLISWLEKVVPDGDGTVSLVDHEGSLASSNQTGTPPSLRENPMVREALSGKRGSLQAIDPISGEESLISYGPVAPIGWVVLSRQPISAVLAPIAALDRAIFGLTFVAFAIIGVLGFHWLRTIRGYHTAIQSSEARFRAVSDTANDAVVSADSSGDIVYFNPAAERIFGRDQYEVIGKSLTLLMPERFRAPHVEGFSRFLETGESRVVGSTVELVGRRKDGTEFPLELSLAHWKVGEESHFTGVLRDITMSKQAEHRIRDLNARLERRASELESANKELEAFSYSVSHDLRAPLRAIDGFSQALLEDYADALDADGRGFLQRVRAGAQHMGRLIDDMLKLSRVSRAEVARETVDLTALSQEIMEMLQQQDPAREVEFEIAQELKAHADGRLMRAALENLISNAWKFSSGKARANIAVGAIENDGAPVYFVKDNGAGFDMAYSENLFGPFQRLHAATEFPGTGIGLATVQRIIHKHGGRIWAEAETDRGATFFFTLEEN